MKAFQCRPTTPAPREEISSLTFNELVSNNFLVNAEAFDVGALRDDAQSLIRARGPLGS